MPTYAYRCASCSHEFDAVQKFSDAPLTTCPECGDGVRRVFQPVGIVFKGSGWYINDSRGADKSGGEAKAPTAPESKSSEKADKPAAAASTPPATTTAAPASAD